MTTEGCDQLAWSGAAALVAAGKHFVGRYVARGTTTRAQIDEAHAAGMDVFLIAEFGATRMLSGRAAGAVDAQLVLKDLQALGAPSGVTVYFAADNSIFNTNLTAVDNYLLGAATVLPKEAVSVYGSAVVTTHCRGTKTAAHTWQTAAWSGGVVDAGADLYQYRNGVPINGHDVDFDRAYVEDFGQWRADMGLQIRLAATATTSTPWSAFGTAKNVSGTGAKRVSDGTMIPLVKGQDLGCVQKGTLVVADQTWPAGQAIYVTNINGQEAAVFAPDVAFTSIAPPAPPAPPTQTIIVTGQNLSHTGPQ